MSPAKKKKPLLDEAWIFGGLMVFFLIVAPIYWFTSKDVVGAVALLLSMLLMAMVFGYLLRVGTKIKNPRPSDNKDAEIIDGAGDLGFYPPHSIWPMWVALSIGVIFLGIVFGWWISLIGIAMGIWATSGLVFEYYRGDYAH